MKQFHVFRHPDGRLDTVKQGFSIPGFLFSGCWLLWHKIWLLGGLMTAVGFGVYLIFPNPEGYIYGIPYGHRFGLADIINIVFLFVVGIFGNRWRYSTLLERGFEKVSTVSAATPDGAKAQYLRSSAPKAGQQGDFERHEPTL
jgi:hypothetical protein